MTTATYTIGETYIINHTRKGSFTVRVEHEDDEWVTGEIMSGQPRYMAQDPLYYKEKGESVTLRKCFISNLPKKSEAA